MKIRDFLVKDMLGYGTSEGVKKSWDTRGHTMNVLKGHGWHSENGTDFNHRIHSGHNISVNKDGSWNHSKLLNNGSSIHEGGGDNSEDLNTHLLNYNWGGKTGRHGVGGR